MMMIMVVPWMIDEVPAIKRGGKGVVLDGRIGEEGESEADGEIKKAASKCRCEMTQPCEMENAKSESQAEAFTGEAK